MSRNKKLDQFDNLIDDLQQSAERPSIPPTFKSELRSQLLNQYEQSRFSWGNVRQWAGTAVALGVLALIVFISWSSLSRQSGAASAYMGTVDVPGRDEFIVYDQLRIEVPMWANEDPGWAELTAESWQSLDGTFFRGEVIDADGKQRVFAQGDGQFLWRGTFDNNVERMETVSLQYFDVYHALAQAEGWDGNATTPPFYDDVGWDGLVQTVLRLDWNCEGAQCVNDYLVEPPLGVNSRGEKYEPFGWGVSLIDTETTANGRSLTTYRIEYSPNQDGLTGSQYRLVTLDSNNHTVVEVADYDGETLLRRLERVSHQIMTNADLPEDQFTHLPAGMGVSYVLPEGRITAETPLLAAPNGEQEATLAEGMQVTLSGLMNNKLPVTQDGIIWQYVTVRDVGQGWVEEASLEWPLASDGQLVDLDTSRLPTAVPSQTQLTILQTYRTELQAILPQSTGEELARLEQALVEIEAEIARLEYLNGFESLGREGIDVVSWGLDQLEINLGEELTLTAFSIEEGNAELHLTLDWLVQERPSADYQLFFHLRDGQGNVTAQVDQPLQDADRLATDLNTGERIRTTLTLTLPDELVADRYDLIIGLYDAVSGVRLPVAVDNPRQSADEGTAVWLTDWFVEHKEALPVAIVSNTEGNGLPLHSEPVGQEIGILEEGSAVILNDEPRLESEGVLWHYVSTTIGKGWVAAEFLTYPDSYVPPETFPVLPDTRVWLISATQHARTSVDDPITLDFTVGYQFESDEEILLQPIYASTDWESHNTGPHTIRSLGNPIPLTKQTGIQSITFTESPERMRQDVETDIDQLVLVMQLYTRAGTDENGNEIPNILTLLTMSGFVIDLTSTEAITFNADGDTAVASPTQHATNDVWLIAATQHARSSADATVMLEITIGYQFESDEEVMLKPLYANPNWESANGGRSPIDGLSDAITLTEKSGTQTITFSASPDEMRQIVGTDQPVLVMQLGYLSEAENGRRELKILAMPTIIDFAIDLSSTAEITYQIDFSDETSPMLPKEAGPVYLESIVQQERHTAVVTFQVIVEQPILDANLQLFLINPDWDFDRTNIQSFQLFLPRTDEEGLFVTATPEQIRQATGTDHPIVAAVLEPFDATNGTTIVQKFPEFPFDLTSHEEIRYTPVNDKSNRNYLEIVDLTPPIGSTLRDETTFTITVQYNLVSLDTAKLVTWLTPYAGGPAIVGNDVQIISQGEGEITFSFSFEPLETNVESDWVLVIRMVDPAEEFPQTALATTSPHDNFPDDVYHFEP